MTDYEPVWSVRGQRVAFTGHLYEDDGTRWDTTDAKNQVRRAGGRTVPKGSRISRGWDILVVGRVRNGSGGVGSKLLAEGWSDLGARPVLISPSGLRAVLNGGLAWPLDAPRQDLTERTVTPEARLVPVEGVGVEFFQRAQEVGDEEARRLESSLVQRFCEWLRSSGHEPCRMEYRTTTGEVLYADVFVEALSLLLEAKPVATRPAVRMALGQLADYSRFHADRPRTAVLTMARPSSDLISLVQSVGSVAVWQDGDDFDATDPMIFSARE